MHWPLALLFGGVAIVLCIDLLEQAMGTEMPTPSDFIPIDSLLMPDKKRLTTNRTGEKYTALSLSGAGNHVMVSTLHGNLPERFTIAFWTKIDAVGFDQTLLMKGENCPDGDDDFKGQSWEIVLQKSGNLSMKLVTAPGNYTDAYVEFSSNKPPPENKWIFIAIAFNPDVPYFQYWLDAEPQKISFRSSTPPGKFKGVNQTKSPLKIGADENFCEYKHQFANFFQGSIDDVYIFNRQLNNDELVTLYADPDTRLYKYKLALLVIMILYLASIMFRRFIAR